jgi:nitroreductase
MEILEAIEKRRSVRAFEARPLPKDALESILKAASLAPSGKNRQPWRFAVVGESKRSAMVEAMTAGIAASEARGIPTGSARFSSSIMAKAAVTVFVLDPFGKKPWEALETPERIMETVDTQSIGAAIQNMLLAATALGIGSLWICDVFYAYEELLGFLGRNERIVAAVSLGYPAERIDARPRLSLAELVSYL